MVTALVWEWCYSACSLTHIFESNRDPAMPLFSSFFNDVEEVRWVIVQCLLGIKPRAD
jgi:hypothetical protein